MKIRAAFSILLSSSLLLALAASPAAASIDSWYFGTGFEIGGIHFRVGYSEAGPFGSSFYFEAAQPLHYGGHACSSRCYRQGPRYYHHPSCRAVSHHFSLYGYAPGYFLEHYGPPVPYPPPYSYGGSPYCCAPPVYYYGAPQWWFGYFGHFDRYRQPKYYGKNDDRWRYERYSRPGEHSRYKRYDHDRRGRDQHPRYDREHPQRDRDRHSTRQQEDRDHQNRGSFDHQRRERDPKER